MHIRTYEFESVLILRHEIRKEKQNEKSVLILLNIVFHSYNNICMIQEFNVQKIH